MNKHQLIDELTELLKEEHPGCDDNTCLINNEAMERYPLNVIEEFSSSGAASSKFLKLTAQLKSKYKSWSKVLRRDARRICRNVAHMQCECNAVIWALFDEYSEGDNVCCSSCGKTNQWTPERGAK